MDDLIGSNGSAQSVKERQRLISRFIGSESSFVGTSGVIPIAMTARFQWLIRSSGGMPTYLSVSSCASFGQQDSLDWRVQKEQSE